MDKFTSKVCWAEGMYGEVFLDKSNHPVCAVLYKPDGSIGLIDYLGNKTVEDID